MRQQVVIWVAMVSAVLLCLVPLFSHNFFRVHDFLHAARTAEMAQMLLDGQFPPRWSSNFGYGFGMPLFEFYAPLPSFISAVLLLLGVPLLGTTQFLFIFATIVALLGSFYLGKLLFGKNAGALLSVLYLLAPYRAVNLFVRGAVSELWAQATYPWILLAVIAVFQNKSWGKYLFTISLCVLFLSHNVSTVMFAPVVFFFILFLVLAAKLDGHSFAQWKNSLLTLIVSGVVAVLISSFYLLPAYLEKDYTQVEERITTGYFSFTQHFISPRQLLVPNWGYGGSVPGISDGLSFFVGYPQLLVLLFSCIVAGVLFVRIKKIELVPARWRYLWFFIGATGVTYFLSLRFSEPVWNVSQIFSFIQFPWRWLGVSSLLLACAGAAAVAISIPEKKQLWIIVGTTIALIFLQRQYFQPESYLSDFSEYYFSDSDRIRDELSPVLPDYLPKTFLEQPIRDELVWTEDGTAISTTLMDSSRLKKVSLVLPKPEVVTLRIAEFPGWQVWTDGDLQTHTTSETGLLQVSVEGGTHQIEAVFTKTPVRWWSDFISLVGVLLFVLQYLYTARKTT
jgi:hypothetical protein